MLDLLALSACHCLLFGMQRLCLRLWGSAQHPPFLYGTHYSCPGYVMYWLVRAAPAHLLRCSARMPVTQSPGPVHGAVCLSCTLPRNL